MILSNIYNRPDPVDDSERVVFHSLEVGQRFKYSVNGPVSTIHSKFPDLIKVLGYDGWIRRRDPDGDSWNAMVIKVESPPRPKSTITPLPPKSQTTLF